jgi:hypothetical protein
MPGHPTRQVMTINMAAAPMLNYPDRPCPSTAQLACKTPGRAAPIYPTPTRRARNRIPGRSPKKSGNFRLGNPVSRWRPSGAEAGGSILLRAWSGLP